MAGDKFREAVRQDFTPSHLVSELRAQKWRGTEPGRIDRMLWIGDAATIEKLAQFAVTEKEWEEAKAEGFEGEILDEYMEALAEEVSKAMKEHVYATFQEGDAFIGQYEDMAAADLRAMGFEIEGSNKPKMAGLSDVPLPPNVDRPEMWTVEAIVKAVGDGFRFMIPFMDAGGLFEPNAYWIKGRQASAHGLTVGPEHTPDIELVDVNGVNWIRASTYFPSAIVPKEAWVDGVNENGVARVYVEINPDTIDWELLNRGHQIWTKRGL